MTWVLLWTFVCPGEIDQNSSIIYQNEDEAYKTYEYVLEYRFVEGKYGICEQRDIRLDKIPLGETNE